MIILAIGVVVSAALIVMVSRNVVRSPNVMLSLSKHGRAAIVPLRQAQHDNDGGADEDDGGDGDDDGDNDDDDLNVDDVDDADGDTDDDGDDNNDDD